MNRDFKGIWIPKEIWLSKELTLQEKIILVEIDSLDNEDGCWASNKYFAEFFGITNGRVSQIINSLEQKKFINIEYEYKGKEIKKRIIRISKSLYNEVFNKLNRCLENDDEVFNKLKGVFNKLNGGYLENYKDNNILYNNINNNITTNSSNNNETIFDFIEKNFGRTLSPVEYEIIETWEDNDLTRHAIKEAILNGKYNLKYINAILHSYSKNGIKTVQQAQEEEFNFKNRHKNVAEHREKLKMLQCNNNVTKCNSIQDIEKDIDKDIEKDIKEKDKKEKFGEFNNVMLTKEEYKKLENANLILYIERLSSYIASTGKKYKSHYATILNWSRKENATKKDYIDKEREEWINAHR